MAEHLPVWQEPVRGGYPDPSILALSGLDRMRATLQGRTPAPPIHHLTGLAPVDAGPGSGTFSMPDSPWLQTPAGYFNAGIMAFVADAPLGTAIASSLPPGKLLTTSDLTMSFLRPVTVESERLIARARLIHAGRSLGLAEVTVEDAKGRLLGHGTTRCFLFEAFQPAPDMEPALAPYAPGHETPDPYLRPVRGEVLPQEVWNRTSGLDVIRGFMSGELPSPPIAELIGGRWTGAEKGQATYEIEAVEWLASPARFLYGGALALIADIGLSGAVQTTIPAATAYSPLDLKVNFIRPVAPDGRTLTVRASVLHRGRSLALASGEIENADGKPVVLFTGSTLVLPGRPWSPARPVVAEEEAGQAED